MVIYGLDSVVLFISFHYYQSFFNFANNNSVISSMYRYVGSIKILKS